MRNFVSNNYRFELTPYTGINSRVICPYCDKKNSFSLYYDTETGEQVAGTVGRCNREDKCGAHYTPSQYFADNPDGKSRFFKDGQHNEYTQQAARHINRREISQNKPATFINSDTFKQSLSESYYHKNNLYKFFVAKFGEQITRDTFKAYNIGTSKSWDKPSTVFWQVDTDGNVRTGKVMYYDEFTGKRVKEPFSYVNWVHSLLKIKDYNLKQCLFGLHLLNDQPKDKPIAIVESEKTSLIASIYMPEFIWMATGAKLHLSPSLFEPLKGREIIFYPDLGAYGEWVGRTDCLKVIADVKVNGAIQQQATEAEYKQGLDIADYLLRVDYRQLQLKQSFINDLLGMNEYSDKRQVSLLRKYMDKGLTKEQAKDAIAELIEQHGFIIDNTAA